MSKYFNYFPKTAYSLDDAVTNLDVITKLSSNFVIDEKFKTNISVYYTYTISDGETPEIIASKLYDDPEAHWVIMAMNNITHPSLQWPKTNLQLNTFIDLKYNGSEYANSNVSGDGIAWSKSNNKSYYIEETVKIISTGDTQKNKIVIDPYLYANTSDSVSTYTLKSGTQIEVRRIKKTESYFDYEQELNETKRNLKILKKEFIPALKNEFIRVME